MITVLRVLLGLAAVGTLAFVLNRERVHWELARSFEIMAAQFDEPWGDS